MADDVIVKDANDQDVPVATRDKGGREVPYVLIDRGGGGSGDPIEAVDEDHPFPTADAAVLAILGTAVTRLTEAVALLTGTLGVAGAVSVTNLPSTQAVSGPLTDAQLRAAAVPVNGPLTDTQLRATAVPVNGPLTDTQLRATAVPVNGPLTDTQLRAAAVPVQGPLTDGQLRASPVEVADDAVLAALAAIATEATIAAINAKLPALLGGRLPVAIGDPMSASGAVLVGNNKSKIRDEFPAGGLNTALWDTIATGSGMTVTTGNGTTGSYLNIASGQTINAETIIRSKDSFTLPVRLAAFVTASNRIINNECFVELIEVDAAGAPVTVAASQTNAGNWRNHTSVKFDGATATSALVTVRSGGAPEFASAGSTITTTAATGSDPNFFPAGFVELQATGEHVALLQAAIDATTAATVARRVTQAAPNPEALYKLQIRVRNLGTAPASSINWRVHAIRLFDYTRFTAEVIGGPGHGAPAMGVPVNVAGGSVGLTGTNLALVGQTAHDAAITGNPARIAARAIAAHFAAVAGGDATDLIADLNGRSVVQLGGIPQLQDRNRIVLSGATETTLIAAVAAVRHGITRLVLTNLNVTDAVQVDIRDTTAGTIRDTYRLPAGQTLVVPTPEGDWQAAVNTNWTAQATGTSPNVVISARSFRVGY
jgi:hypothetical protein